MRNTSGNFKISTKSRFYLSPWKCPTNSIRVFLCCILWTLLSFDLASFGEYLIFTFLTWSLIALLDCSVSSFSLLFLFLLFICFHYFFFYQGFLSQTLTIHRTAGEGRGPSFIPLYHFHPLTNIETLICNFACEMNIIILNRNACVYQAATLWDLPTYGITIWLIEWWCNVCLFTW